jgi:hypothetical protein
MKPKGYWTKKDIRLIELACPELKDRIYLDDMGEGACRVAGTAPRQITRGREMTIEDMRDMLRDPGIPERYASVVTRALGAMSGVWSRESRVRTVGQWLDATSPKSDVRKFVEFIAEIR